jgi:hypothetical protein
VQVGADRVGDRARHTSQRGLVKDDLDACAGSGAGLRIGEVAFDELHGLETREVSALASNKIVDAADGFATFKQFSCDGSADEAGGASDEILRQCLLR